MNDTTFQGDGKVAYVPVVVDAKPKPITNAMKIRSMSDEELAKWIDCHEAFAWCPPNDQNIDPITKECLTNDACWKCVLAWLRKYTE